MTNYTAFSRQGVAEQVTIKEDGSICQAEMTSCGLNAGPLRGYGTYAAAVACVLRSAEGAVHYDGANEGEAGEYLRAYHPAFQQDGEDREDAPDQHIVNMKDGAVAGFKYFQMDGVSTVRVCTRGSAGTMQISTSDGGKICGEILVAESDSWQESKYAEVSIPDGVSALYFTYRGAGAVDFLNFTLERV